MGFLNPLMLWGTLGVLIPIAIHLLNRYRHREIDWAAMELLRRALVIRARQIRLEDILILILRCLAVLLIALAMARPTIRPSAAGWFGAHAQVGAVIALDGSYSMAHRPGVKTRFARAVERVREILDTLDAGSPLTLVLMGNRPRILLRNVGYNENRLDRLLKDLTPLPERLNLEPCLEELESLVREVMAPVRECYLVTDAQAATWEELSEKASLSLREIGAAAHVFFLSTASESVENVALTRFALASGTLRKGTMARYVAEVRNFGRSPKKDVAVTLLLNENPVCQRVLARVAAGEAEAVPLFARFAQAGNTRLSARLDQDPLTTDNTRHAVACVREHVRVLCVDGEPSDKPYQGETDYLVTALAPVSAAPSRTSLQVKTVPRLLLPAQRLSEYQVVILANVPDIHRDQVAALHNFVEQGGGLIVFLGDKIIPRLFNARMRDGASSLLPGEIVALGNPGNRPLTWSLEAAMTGHPISRVLATLPRDLLNQARFKQFFKIRLDQGARTILKLAGSGAPLLAEKSVGRGHVLLYTSTADREWTDFVVHPAYPILLHQAVTYLSRQAHERSVTVGEPLVVPLPAQTAQPSAIFRDPSGEQSPIQVTERDGERVAQYTKTDWPGFYEVRHAPGVPPIVAAVNVDPTESDVRSLERGQVAAAFRGLPVRPLPWGEELAVAVRQTRVGRELWRVLLLVGLGVLLLEAFLAHRFSKRIETGASAPSFGSREEILPGGEPAKAE